MIKIIVLIITCILALCSCGHTRDMTEEEQEEYMQEEGRKELRDLTGKGRMF